MPDLERRTLGSLEVRGEGRALAGQALRYGDVSPSHRERFAPGAIRVSESAWLNYRHDQDKVLAWRGAGLVLDTTESGLFMRAELPTIPLADRVLAEVRAGALTGLSIEFRAISERAVDGLREVTDALVEGLAVCSKPSYSTTLEAREASHRAYLWSLVL